MISILELSEAIAARIHERWPERTIYRDVCPADFERPSFFLSCNVWEQTPEMGLLSMTAKLELEIFDEADEYYVTASERLMETQEEVLALFAGGNLAVADRHITVVAEGHGREPESAFMLITAEWMDCAEAKGPEFPAMDEFDFDFMTEKE